MPRVKMGNCFSECTQNEGSSSSSGREKNAKGKRKGKRTGKKKSCGNKNSSENSPSLRRKNSLSITSVQSISDGDTGEQSESTTEGNQGNMNLTVTGHAIPVLAKQSSPEIETTESNTKIIVVKTFTTDENPSNDSIEIEVRKPITSSESNVLLSHSPVVEQSTGNEELEELSNDEEARTSPPAPCPSGDQEGYAQNSHFQLLEFLKIRLDMAANNMEMNRLLSNVDRALDRAARSRKLGFKRMRAAAEPRRAAREIQEETVIEEEETETEDSDESDESYEGYNDIDDTLSSPSPPPPIPRICWQ